MKYYLAALIIAMYLTMNNKSLAITIPEGSKPPVPAIVYSPKNTEMLIFRGTIRTTHDGDGTALYTEQAVYPLLGGDFAMIIGEEVNIIGKIIREDDIEKIVVARVQFERE